MTIKNFNFKFIYTAENSSNLYSSDHEIMIRINAILVLPDLAGGYMDVSYIYEAFEKLGFSDPIFSYNKISASRDISLSEFIKNWEPDDPFGIQIMKDSDFGHRLNFNSPRDVIPKKR